ncbi:hypothetical protein [Microvirga sp. G4-2]|uniref:hypothetical protein n=1 Tax=Microvirga sp. G4-2 TaxID=3434467 RepID=UPI0040440119
MSIPSDHPLLRRLGQGFAVAALLAGMALMAFAAGLALLGAMIGLPIAIGLMAVRQRLPGGPGAVAVDAATAWRRA